MRVIGSPEKVINRNIEVICNFDEFDYSGLPVAGFISAYCVLAHVQVQ